MGTRKKKPCARDGDYSVKAQVDLILRQRRYAITTALQAKICRGVVGFDYSNVRVVDLLDWKSSPN